ncbi:hypothetical protein GE061_000076 [Apolygus lucorum]|uniref:Uncharacterized protein n=1 Tax=Apolygus lucorum TaxID=248454 RepID=A0A8S9Y3L4_APOLU|nr:hypothetical protein GE061_000076 [Apolygus lucorum]
MAALAPSSSGDHLTIIVLSCSSELFALSWSRLDAVPANTAVVRERVPVGRSFHNAIVIDVKGSSLMLNGTAVDTVYDYKSLAWFKSNDVAAALGFANACSSVSQHIHSNDKLSFGSISLHNDSPEWLLSVRRW